MSFLAETANLYVVSQAGKACTISRASNEYAMDELHRLLGNGSDSFLPYVETVDSLVAACGVDFTNGLSSCVRSSCVSLVLASASVTGW